MVHNKHKQNWYVAVKIGTISTLKFNEMLFIFTSLCLTLFSSSKETLSDIAMQEMVLEPRGGI